MNNNVPTTAARNATYDAEFKAGLAAAPDLGSKRSMNTRTSGTDVNAARNLSNAPQSNYGNMPAVTIPVSSQFAHPGIAKG